MSEPIWEQLPVCPDCAATVVDQRFDHNPGCAIAAEVEAMSEADRDYFEAHPSAEYYFRRPRPGDFQVSSLDDIGFDPPNAKVCVRNLAPGVRTRLLPRNAFLVVGPDGPSSNVLFMMRWQHWTENTDKIAELPESWAEEIFRPFGEESQ